MAPNAITISFQKKPHSMPMLLSQRGQDQEALFLKVKQHVFLKASLKKTGEMKDKHHKNTPVISKKGKSSLCFSKQSRADSRLLRKMRESFYFFSKSQDAFFSQ